MSAAAPRLTHGRGYDPPPANAAQEKQGGRLRNGPSARPITRYRRSVTQIKKRHARQAVAMNLSFKGVGHEGGDFVRGELLTGCQLGFETLGRVLELHFPFRSSAETGENVDGIGGVEQWVKNGGQ